MSETVLNETDLLLVRRLISATKQFNRYSEAIVAEAKLLAELLEERFGAQRADPLPAGRAMARELERVEDERRAAA